MKVVALISGGKDSCHNMMQCAAEGHEIVALANLRPEDLDEMDSYMYQTVGHHAVELYAEAMDLPLYRRTIQGTARNTKSDYEVDALDEVEDLVELLKSVMADHAVEGVSVGAILSNYQRVRVENVCSRLGLTSLAFLWRREQDELLREMINCRVEAVIIKVAAMGLVPDDLGKTIEDIYPKMKKLASEYGLNVCGEGGEYETFTLDCPLFDKRLVIDEQEVVMHSDTPFAPVAYINFKKMHLAEKNISQIARVDRLRDLPMKLSRHCRQEIGMDDITFEDVPLAEYEYEKSTLSLSKTEPSQSSRQPELWLAGLTCLDSESAEEATKDVMEQLGKTLGLHGVGYGDVCVVHLYVRDMIDFVHINRVYRRYFSLNPPVRICVEADLCVNQPLLLNCYVRSENTVENETDIKTMHVRGLSHWAPANIGPYSQCKQVDRQLYVAGQIALVPGSMTLVEGGPVAQCRLSLRHVKRIVEAMSNQRASMRHVTSMICYVTDAEVIKTARSELEEETKNCSTSYLVIPKLPRNAAVEWEAVAHLDHEDSNLIKSKKTIASYQIESSVYTINGKLINGHIMINNKIGFEIPFSSECLYSNLNEFIRWSFRDVEEGGGLLRVFYRCEHFGDGMDLTTRVTEALKSEKIVVAIAFVPVLEFARPDGLLCLVKT